MEAHEVVDCEDDVEDLPARDEAVPVEVVQRERPPQALVRRPAKERRQGDQHVLQEPKQHEGQIKVIRHRLFIR